MTYVNEFLNNQLLMSGIIGWLVAQFLKTVIDIALNQSFNPERLVGSGGMPSSHSSTMCALTTAAFMAMVVMYDAIGVRQETGKQAKLLNSLVFENVLKLDAVLLQKKLKEYVGHTPLQVVAGAVLGIAIAIGMAGWF